MTEKKKTFEEWIKGFEDRYTPEQIQMFKDTWDHALYLKEMDEKAHAFAVKYAQDKPDNIWYLNWIHNIAYKLGK